MGTISIHAGDDEGDLSIPAFPSSRVRDALTITIFGASGDLTQRKLIPALYAMYVQGFLPPEFAVVGFARRTWTDEAFRQQMAEGIRTFGRIPVQDEVLRSFCARLHYHEGDIESAASYDSLQKKLYDLRRFPPNHLFYLSIRPELFSTVLERMKASRLIARPGEDRWTRVVIEKPFGRDLASARQLNRDVLAQLEESQVYRIDHFLGKETVQNILSFRFANAIFEPLFNHHFVDHIQITAAETVGMESGRGAYYDSSGALRDMVQNHMLQLLCLVTMDPAGQPDRRRHPQREAQGPAIHRAPPLARRAALRGARAVRGGGGGRAAPARVPPGGPRRAGLPHRKLRGAAARH
jgi:glucose-6-phosphate 1-dehydrogenase